jgi:hypothetical protein
MGQVVPMREYMPEVKSRHLPLKKKLTRNESPKQLPPDYPMTYRFNMRKLSMKILIRSLKPDQSAIPLITLTGDLLYAGPHSLIDEQPTGFITI